MASTVLLVLFALWRPLPAPVWDLSGSTAGAVLRGVSWAGWGLVLTSTFLIGIQLEERDLIAQFGERYRTYRRQVGMLLPRPGRRTTGERAPD